MLTGLPHMKVTNHFMNNTTMSLLEIQGNEKSEQKQTKEIICNLFLFPATKTWLQTIMLFACVWTQLCCSACVKCLLPKYLIECFF